MKLLFSTIYNTIKAFFKFDKFEKRYFATIDDAVVHFAKEYNSTSIIRGKELGSRVYKKETKRGTMYYYTRPFIGTPSSIVGLVLPALKFWNVVATIHTHSCYNPMFDCNNFSPQDKKFLSWQGFVYVVTPNGSVRKYYKDNDVEYDYIVGRHGVPSDANDPNRLNNVPIRPAKRTRFWFMFW